MQHAESSALLISGYKLKMQEGKNSSMSRVVVAIFRAAAPPYPPLMPPLQLFRERKMTPRETPLPKQRQARNQH